jgi:hypothetical protein
MYIQTADVIGNIYGSTEVFANLYDVTGQDDGLGWNPVSDYQLQVTYTRNSTSIGAGRVDYLVNTLPEDVVIAGVDSTYVLNGKPITDVIGSADIVAGQAVVTYDTSQCGNDGYFVFDDTGAKIANPNFIILYHELSHVFLLVTTGVAPTEAQVIPEENDLRSERGLPLRDPNNHQGGCYPHATPNPAPSSSPCFIATAAAGSSTGERVRALRRLRDRHLRSSSWGELFFQQLFREYYRFSPQVAAAMRRSESLRIGIDDLCVAPLLRFFETATTFVDSRGTHASSTALRECRMDRAVLGEMAMAVRDLRRSSRAPRIPPGPTAAIVAEFSRNGLRSTRRRMPYVDWALLEPLLLAYRTMTEDVPAPVADARLRERIEEWLTRMPLPSASSFASDDERVAELRAMADAVFTTDSIRRQIALRLVECDRVGRWIVPVARAWFSSH